MSALATQISKEQEYCDVLINNAGVYHYMTQPTTEQRREMIDINYRGTLAVRLELELNILILWARFLLGVDKY